MGTKVTESCYIDWLKTQGITVPNPVVNTELATTPKHVTANTTNPPDDNKLVTYKIIGCSKDDHFEVIDLQECLEEEEKEEKAKKTPRKSKRAKKRHAPNDIVELERDFIDVDHDNDQDELILTGYVGSFRTFMNCIWA